MDKIKNNTAGSLVIGNHTLTAGQTKEFIFAHYNSVARGLMPNLVADTSIEFLDRLENDYTFDINEYNDMLNTIEYTEADLSTVISGKTNRDAARFRGSRKRIENVVGSAADVTIRDSNLITESEKQFYKIGKAVV